MFNLFLLLQVGWRQDLYNQQFDGYPSDEGSALSWFVMGAAALYIYLKVRGRVND